MKKGRRNAGKDEIVRSDAGKKVMTVSNTPNMQAVAYFIKCWKIYDRTNNHEK
jgi:hypothetical protein